LRYEGIDCLHAGGRFDRRHLVILLALMQREKTGVGQAISVSLYDSMLAMQKIGRAHV